MPNRRGRIYRRGKIWWLQYSYLGQDRRESTKSTNRKVAEKLLTARMSAKDQGTLPEGTVTRLCFEDLAVKVEQNYTKKHNRSLDRAQDAFKALAVKFAGFQTYAITTDRLEEYWQDRKAAGMADATIVYEIRMLKRGFKLAKLAPPFFEAPAIDNARQGFFERQDFERVLSYLPPYLRPVMEFGYYTGWRVISEVLPLQWKQVDWQAGTVKLEVGTTKNGEGRIFPFAQLPQLAAVLKTQWEQAQHVMVSQQRICPWVFFRALKREVLPIRSYKTAWGRACRLAGLPDALVHDFRRTAARNLRLAGVEESEAMDLLGHKTREMFRRYSIKNQEDKVRAVDKLAQFHAQQSLRDTYGTIEPIRTGEGLT
ncbi:MAG: site-specific integrase [Nitrospira sp.]|nr:site-specific integrase [Nitrospira sp.]